AARWPDARERFQERRLPRAAGADERHELPRRNSQIRWPEDGSFAYLHRNARCAEALPTLVADDNLVALDPQAKGPDPGHRIGAQRLVSLDQLCAEANPIAGTEIDDARRVAGSQLGVMPRDVRLLEADVVVGGPTYTHGTPADRNAAEPAA